MGPCLQLIVFLVHVISCSGEVIKDNYRLEKMPDGYAVHPKYVLNEHVVDNSNIECASYCSIVLLCSHFVRSGSICWIVSKLVLAQSAQTFSNVTVGQKVVPVDLYGWNVYHHIPVAIHNAQDMEHFPRNAFSLNRFDLSQNVYSRADDIPCRYGKYNFELYYPELENSIFKWEQTSDPMNTSITPAQGFSLISGPPDYTPHPVIPFVGLQSDSRFYAMMDGSHQHAYFFSVGLYKWAIIGAQEKQGLLPGPISARGFELVKLVELYVVMPIDEVEDVILKL